MSKGIEHWYSKWDNLELSDDEDDVHPMMDKESWLSMKHRSRVEREMKEAMESQEIEAAMTEANHRIKVLRHDWKMLDEAEKVNEVDCGDDVDGDDAFDDAKGINVELDNLFPANELRNKRLEGIDKHKTRNVDNIGEVKRTTTNTNAAKVDYTSTGFAEDKENLINRQAMAGAIADRKHEKADVATSAVNATKAPAAACAHMSAATTKSDPACHTYLEFKTKYSHVVEGFMQLQSLKDSKDYILKYGDVLFQVFATGYLLDACLEDEMNGHRKEMKQKCRQTGIIAAIPQFALTKQQHPRNVVIPFFKKLEQKVFHAGVFAAIEVLCQTIIDGAVTKRMELERKGMDEGVGRNVEERITLHDLKRRPLEERLGPGGLDPMEVLRTLPVNMQQAFIWSNVGKLEEALLSMDSDDRDYHTKRCVDSGLWKKHS